MSRATRFGAATLAVLLGLLLVGQALAQSGGPHNLSWWTVDGGGAVVEAGGYRLGVTGGQPDAAVWIGGPYRLHGGFWVGVTPEYPVYLPLVVREAA